MFMWFSFLLIMKTPLVSPRILQLTLLDSTKLIRCVITVKATENINISRDIFNMFLISFNILANTSSYTPQLELEQRQLRTPFGRRPYACWVRETPTGPRGFCEHAGNLLPKNRKLCIVNIIFFLSSTVARILNWLARLLSLTPELFTYVHFIHVITSMKWDSNLFSSCWANSWQNSYAFWSN